MPKTWSTKKKSQYALTAHQQTPDIDNLLKGFLDALYARDEIVYSVHAEKIWDHSGKIHLMVDCDDIEARRIDAIESGIKRITKDLP